MFNKKIKCRCGKKIDVKYDFCPYCGADLKAKLVRDKARDKEVDGMIKQVESAFNVPFFMKFPFEKLVKQMVKEVDKQFHEYDAMLSQEQNEVEKNPNVIASGISISVNTSPEGEPVIEVKQFGQGQEEKPQISKVDEPKQYKKLPKSIFTEAETLKLSKLPRQEPKTKVRRLTDKIIYEISLPGVKQEKNIIIHKLQNSIEIKAFAKDKAYFKLIPLDLTIKDYKLSNEVLILELKP